VVLVRHIDELNTRDWMLPSKMMPTTSALTSIAARAAPDDVGGTDKLEPHIDQPICSARPALVMV
jgi:hypothetical protein